MCVCFSLIFETAEYVGIKESVPAYLDPTLGLEDLLTGVTFASAGSGFDPVTAQITVRRLHLSPSYIYMYIYFIVSSNYFICKSKLSRALKSLNVKDYI